jgi:hypothetical protein
MVFKNKNLLVEGNGGVMWSVRVVEWSIDGVDGVD